MKTPADPPTERPARGLAAPAGRTGTAAPPVSVGMPVYNGADYLAEAIASVLEQTFGDFELVIADNASTDRTEEICRAFAASDSRIRYLRRPQNMGAANNYNTVFAEARGTYFKWAAHDDLLRPQFLARCLEVFRTRDDAPSVVHPRSAIIDRVGRVIRHDPNRLATRSPLPAVRAFVALQHMGLASACMGLLRREAIARTRLIGAWIASDNSLILEAALAGRIIQLGGEPLYLRRQHEKTSMAANAAPRDLLAWFDPGATNRLRPRHKLYLEYMKSPWLVGGLGPLERVACSGAVVAGIAANTVRWRYARLRGLSAPVGAI